MSDDDPRLVDLYDGDDPARASATYDAPRYRRSVQ
jgi:hypothetical protein